MNPKHLQRSLHVKFILIAGILGMSLLSQSASAQSETPGPMCIDTEWGRLNCSPSSFSSFVNDVYDCKTDWAQSCLLNYDSGWGSMQMLCSENDDWYGTAFQRYEWSPAMTQVFSLRTFINDGYDDTWSVGAINADCAAPFRNPNPFLGEPNLEPIRRKNGRQ